MGQQCFGAAGPLLDPLMAAFGERAVAGEVIIALRLGRIDQFLAGRIRPVERNRFNNHFPGSSFYRIATENEVIWRSAKKYRPESADSADNLSWAGDQSGSRRLAGQ